MVRAPRSAPWSVRLLVTLCAVLAWSGEATAQKTDTITLDNGDRITCATTTRSYWFVASSYPYT